MIAEESIKKDILEYFESHLGIIDVREDEMLLIYSIDDLDLVELELHLEEKHGIYPKNSDGADINDNNTLAEIIRLLYFYLNENYETNNN